MFRKTEIIGIGFFIVLFAGLAFIGARTVSQVPVNADLIEELQALTVRLCEEGNARDAKQIALWDTVISLAQPQPHEDPVERTKRIETFREFVKTTFAPVDCSAPEEEDL